MTSDRTPTGGPPAAARVRPGVPGGDAAERRESVLLAVAAAANLHDDLDSAAREAMGALTGRHGSWDAAHLIYPAAGPGGALTYSGVWSFHTDEGSAGFEPLVAARPRGEEPASGQVPDTVRWYSPLDHALPDAGRRELESCGVRSWAVAPILIGKTPVAAIELFSQRSMQASEERLDVMGTAGTLLGRVVEREEAARAAASALDRVAAVTRISPEAIVSVDSQGTVVGWNDSAQALFGWGSGDMLGGSLQRLFPTRLREQHTAGLEALLSGRVPPRPHGTDPAIVKGVHRDGHEVVAEAFVGTWAEEGQLFLSVYLRDRAVREAAEQAARHRDEALVAARHAVELNDSVIQSLVVALYRLDAGEVDEATQALRGTLGAAQDMVSRLMEFGDSKLTAAQLQRRQAATAIVNRT